MLNNEIMDNGKLNSSKKKETLVTIFGERSFRIGANCKIELKWLCDIFNT